MNLKQLRSYCTAKPAVEEDFPFDFETLVFKVGGKMFALTNIEREELFVNLKCDPAWSLLLRDQYDAIEPGYHMNKKHWNTLLLDGSLEDSFVKELIDHSYDLVFKKLPKIKRESIAKEV